MAPLSSLSAQCVPPWLDGQKSVLVTQEGKNAEVAEVEALSAVLRHGNLWWRECWFALLRRARRWHRISISEHARHYTEIALGAPCFACKHVDSNPNHSQISSLRAEMPLVFFDERCVSFVQLGP